MLERTYEQQAAVDAADLWTAEQVRRLGCKPGDIMAAIKSGWTAGDVRRISAADASDLNSSPPHILNAIRKLRDAPILPVRASYETKRRFRR